jgi:hypothetical protein
MGLCFIRKLGAGVTCEGCTYIIDLLATTACHPIRCRLRQAYAARRLILFNVQHIQCSDFFFVYFRLKHLAAQAYGASNTGKEGLHNKSQLGWGLGLMLNGSVWQFWPLL